MNRPPDQQTRTQQREQQRAREKPQSRPARPERPPKRRADEPALDAPQAGKQQKAGTEMVSESVVEGVDGARNLAIEHLNVEVGNDFPSYEVVTTLPENQLQVEYRQLNWVKTYQGTGRVQTDVCPIAPLGTVLVCTARDLTTGEEMVREYKWHSIGSAMISWLWKMLKRLFVRDAG